jgi:hypothetical protein
LEMYANTALAFFRNMVLTHNVLVLCILESHTHSLRWCQQHTSKFFSFLGESILVSVPKKLSFFSCLLSAITLARQLIPKRQHQKIEERNNYLNFTSPSPPWNQSTLRKWCFYTKFVFLFLHKYQMLTPPHPSPSRNRSRKCLGVPVFMYSQVVSTQSGFFSLPFPLLISFCNAQIWWMSCWALKGWNGHRGATAHTRRRRRRTGKRPYRQRWE